MILDVKTLFVADALITAIIGLALLFYRANSKTYPGFGFWMTGSFFAAAGYSATFLRGVIPVWSSVLLANAAFVLAGVLRLDGMMRFLEGRVLRRLCYAAPVLSLALSAYFCFARDDILIRVAILTAFICLFTWAIALVFIRSAPDTSKTLYYTAGGVGVIYGLAMLTRTILWMRSPGYGIFDNTGFHSAFFISVFIYEIWFGLLIMMMNNRRLGAELHESENNLKTRVVELKNALSEIKTLKGLLPICSCCKKIRDDQGYWSQLETYIHLHSEATFTHGLCPECAERMRKEIDEIIAADKK